MLQKNSGWSVSSSSLKIPATSLDPEATESEGRYVLNVDPSLLTDYDDDSLLDLDRPSAVPYVSPFAAQQGSIQLTESASGEKLSQRQLLVREIVLTEQAYVDDLGKMIQVRL